MLREGSKAYGKALGDLRRTLLSHRVRMDVPIATIKLLAMFEVRSIGWSISRLIFSLLACIIILFMIVNSSLGFFAARRRQ